MNDGIHSRRPTRPAPARLLALVTLLSGALTAGCGASSTTTTTVTVDRAPASTSSTARSSARTTVGGSGAVSGAGTPNALAFANCMRANGVPNFPDPEPGGGFAFPIPAGFQPGAPAVISAQAKCGRFMPHPPSGPSVGGSSPQQSAQALAQLRRVARCMRQHGISDFPDPQTSTPSNLNPAGYSNITNYEGVFLLFPATINMQSPAWEQAAAACGPLAESFNHPHH
jgi:hypothetical protein